MSPIVAMYTSEADLIGACACEREIQFRLKWAPVLGFRQYAPTPLFKDNTGVYSSRREWACCRPGPSTFACAGC